MDRIDAKLTAVANEIRELTGAAEKLGLDDMAVNVREGNDEILMQKDLIEQAVAALEGKVSPDLYNQGYADGYEIGNSEGLKALSGVLDETHTEVADSTVTYLRKFALAFNATMESVDFKNVQSTGEHVFYQCYQLKYVNLPNLTTPGTYVFRDCTALETLILPKVVTLTYGICQNAKNLVRVDTSSITKIDNASFLDCLTLATLILRNSKMATLSATRAFDGTPIANGTGYIYVPDNLVDSYKSATNWSVYANQIKPLSELEG